MRMHGAALGVLGDFVPADTSGFLATIGPSTGLGDFVPGATNGFLATLGPDTGLSGLGCGEGCGCGPCRASQGMGAIDWSLTGTGILSSISPTLTVPNWAVYGAAALLGVMFAMGGGTAARRRR